MPKDLDATGMLDQLTGGDTGAADIPDIHPDGPAVRGFGTSRPRIQRREVIDQLAQIAANKDVQVTDPEPGRGLIRR